MQKQRQEKDWVRREVSGWFEEGEERQEEEVEEKDEVWEGEEEDEEEDEDDEYWEDEIDKDGPTFRDWRGAAAMPPADAKGWTVDGPSSRSAATSTTSRGGGSRRGSATA